MKTGKIMVMTSMSRGGIAQFAFFLAKEMKVNKHVEEVVLMVPRDSEYSVSGNVHIDFYDKVDTMRPDAEKYEEIIEKIDKHKPTHIIFTEISTPNIQLGTYIKDRYPLSTVIHDALNRHGIELKGWIKEKYFQRLINQHIEDYTKVVVLSGEVHDELDKRFPIAVDKAVEMKLCSHLHVMEDVQCGNMIGEDYFLFFGRIQKYKGLETLFEAYAKDRNKLLPKLVIAGKGDFTKREQELFDQIKNNVILMKKYITDETLASLLSCSKGTILPYIEATQSGLIPMSYQYGKPVVVSDRKGLVENVKDGVTGYVFPRRDSTALYTILKKIMMSDDEEEVMSAAIGVYYKENYNWTEHVSHLVHEIMPD